MIGHVCKNKSNKYPGIIRKYAVFLCSICGTGRHGSYNIELTEKEIDEYNKKLKEKLDEK